MSKIVCEICGTSYQETATQCPICGSARPDDVAAVEGSGAASYTYVKGGRFSKANVRKRNRGQQVAQATRKTAPSKESKPEKSEGGNRGLVITAVVLMLAVIAVVGYIVVSYFLPDEPAGPANVQETIPCVSVAVDESTLTFDAIGDTKEVKVTVKPSNTTDTISFASDDPSIATVDENGKIEIVGSGVTTVRVKCGTAEAAITVICDVVDDSQDSSDNTEVPFVLTRKELTLTYTGETYILYAGQIDVSQIFWSSDNEDIATIEAGVVKAVGKGTTTVHGEYLGTKVSCSVMCNFVDDEDTSIGGSGGGIGEDGGDISGSGGAIGEDGGNTGTVTPDNGDTSADGYYIHNVLNPGGTEPSVSVNGTFLLEMRDSSGKTVDATWTSEDPGVCSVSNGTVTGVGSGTTNIVATFNGVSVKMKVIVW